MIDARLHPEPVFVDYQSHRSFSYCATHQVCVEVEHGYKLAKPDQCTDSIYQLMLSCWHNEPEQRPTMRDLAHALRQAYSVLAAHISLHQPRGGNGPDDNSYEVPQKALALYYSYPALPSGSNTELDGGKRRGRGSGSAPRATVSNDVNTSTPQYLNPVFEPRVYEKSQSDGGRHSLVNDAYQAVRTSAVGVRDGSLLMGSSNNEVGHATSTLAPHSERPFMASGNTRRIAAMPSFQHDTALLSGESRVVYEDGFMTPGDTRRANTSKSASSAVRVFRHMWQ
jgi:hypothetical protein